MRVRWSHRALERAEEIADQIVDERPNAAADWMDGLFDLARSLAHMPERGRVVPEIGRADIRELQYRGYRVVYRVKEDQVGILTIRHARQRMDPHDMRE